MAKKYRTGNATWNDKIEAIEIERETASTVWFYSEWYGKRKLEQERKDGAHHKFHDTWEAAREHLLAYARRSVENTKMRLQAERSRLGQLESLKNPVTLAAELTEPASQELEVDDARSQNPGRVTLLAKS